MDAREAAGIEQSARQWAAGVPLRDEADLAAAVEFQLARLAPPQLVKKRATVLAMAQVGLTIPGKEDVFARPDTISKRVYHDPLKGWAHDPLYREIEESVKALYDRWVTGAAAREAAAEFVEREAQLRQAEWQASRDMTRLALEMARTPLHELETTQDGKTVIVRPARWTFDTLPRMADAASKLGRLSLGMTPGGRQEVVVDWREGLPEGVTPEQAEQVKLTLARMLAAGDGADEEEDDDE